MTRIAVHGHFYQPPRENPWTGEVPEQPGAAPFHDWNERVHSECYEPNAFARTPTPDGEIVANNFERLSFNIGPTLMGWLEQKQPKTYRRIIEGDRQSIERTGFGGALAQSYHHTILPLSSSRDVRTQIKWGLADFRHHYGRDAAGMWLPETAANDAVLDVLIEEGARFTILAHHQAQRWRAPGGEWIEVDDEALDPRRPYRYSHRDGSGRSITLFFYDGGISRAIAFEKAGSSAEGFLELFEAAAIGATEDVLIHAATDGETYGHHHPFTELGLAFALFVEAGRRGIAITNYAAHLEEFPADHDVELVPGEGTSWSCAHGVGRWSRHCGCSTGGAPGWNQKWRAPLRAGLELVQQTADEVFERMGTTVFKDPWAARDDYIEVVVGEIETDAFLDAHAAGPLGPEERALGQLLLELQRYSMSMFTSCAWFFNDVAGIETVQILMYAARVVDLLDELGQPAPVAALMAELQKAVSNEPERGSAAEICPPVTTTRSDLPREVEHV